MSAFLAVDPTTGEVLEERERQRVADEAARRIATRSAEIAALARKRAELADQLLAVEALQAQDLTIIRRTVPVDGRADGGFAWITVAPGKKSAQRVSSSGCAPWREPLLALGLGMLGPAPPPPYKAPTLTELKAARAELAAAGIPFTELAPEPREPEPVVQVVPKTIRVIPDDEDR